MHKWDWHIVSWDTLPSALTTWELEGWEVFAICDKNGFARVVIRQLIV